MGTVWFLAGFLILYLSIVCLKKSEKTQNLFSWCIMAVIIIMCYQAFIAAVMNLLKIPINLWTVGMGEIALGGYIWWNIYRKHQRQEYYFRKRDIGAALLLLIPVVLAAIHQFGTGLNINYASADGVTHFRMALKVIQNSRIEKMCFAPLNNALFIEIFMPFFKETQLFHVFILSDILMYYLAGITFYCAISVKKDTGWKWIFEVLISVFYMIGYPRNNLLYGFNYLGMSIMLALFLAWILYHYLYGSIYKNISIILLMLGCYSVGVCYSLFAPVVYFSVCMAVSVNIWSKRERGSWKWLKIFVADNLKIFLLPCILVFIYSFMGVFVPNESGAVISTGIAEAGNDIAKEGGIYRDLFSNFIFWLPFAMFGIYDMLKRRMNDLMVYYALFLSIFILILGYKGMKLEVSSYYYYKNYFFLSAVIFYLAFYGISVLLVESKQFVLSSISVFLILGAATVFNLEGLIQGRNIMFAPSNKSGYYFDIYTVNYQIAEGLEDYAKDKIKLYEYFDKTFPRENSDNIIVCAQMVDTNIFCVVTQRLDRGQFIFWRDLSDAEKEAYSYFTESEKRGIFIKDDKIDFNEYYQVMQDNARLEDDMPFLYLYDSEEEYKDLMDLKGNDIEILYENTQGFVAIMKNCKE